MCQVSGSMLEIWDAVAEISGRLEGERGTWKVFEGVTVIGQTSTGRDTQWCLVAIAFSLKWNSLGMSFRQGNNTASLSLIGTKTSASLFFRSDTKIEMKLYKIYTITEECGLKM